MPMVYGFTRQAGGHVHIDSVEGQGTRVDLHLPCGEIALA
ncbi:PAS protein [Pseudomonas amygdali pv. mellea]|nr:PAS protein [Pseudomonas amygdali pv. mellea]